MARDLVLAEVADRIAAVRPEHTLRVAIDGIDAAGKTTLADELAPLLEARGRPVIRATIDGFHNPQAVRYQRGRLSPEGYYQDSFNLAAVVDLLLTPLSPGGDGVYRSAAFDYRVDAPVTVAPQQAPPEAILLFDGIFLARPELAPYWDLFLFIHISFDTCLARAWERNKGSSETEETVRHRYQTRYLPAQRAYLAAHQPMDRADLVLYNDVVAALRVENRD